MSGDQCFEWTEAVSLAREGFAVFPVHIAHRHTFCGKTIIHCSCGKGGTVGRNDDIICKGKHPDCKFSEVSTTDIERINRFGSRWMTRGIGVHLGKSHAWVLDIDGEEGYAELDKLTSEHGELTATRTIKTGSGGMHFVFAGWVDKIHSGKLAPHIDVKGNVGHAYHVVPPTRHHSGNRYEYIDRVLPADAPEWLIKLVQDKTYTRNPDARKLDAAALEARKTFEVPIWKLLTRDQIGLLHQEGPTLRGSHPVHGSTTKRNFAIDLNTNRWFCNNHVSTGGLFELAAVLSGICKCEDFKRGAKNPLIGKKFIEVVGAASQLGVSTADIRRQLNKGVALGGIC